MKLSQFQHTDTGAVRSRNEDDLLALPEVGFWVVCDGMGGHDAGNYASGHIVSRLRTASLTGRSGGRLQHFLRCLQESNAHLLAYTHDHGFSVVGSTVVALHLQDGRATVVWVGDSRAYRLRGAELRLMTRDHSVAEENAERGLASGEDCSSAITRAVGVVAELEIDLLSSQTSIGDTWLLCSDGVSGALSDQDMLPILQGSEDPARELVAQAIANGSRDNCTAIVLRLEP